MHHYHLPDCAEETERAGDSLHSALVRQVAGNFTHDRHRPDTKPQVPP